MGTQYIHPLQGDEVVKIKMSGKRTGTDGDFHLANQEAGLSGTKAPDGYVWHHMDGFDPRTGECSMQLVEDGAHTRVEGMAHSGSVDQYKAYYIIELGS